jgi:hypothetical protein
MRELHRCMLAGIIAASVSSAPRLEAQAFDSLGRPRPLSPPVQGARDSTHLILHCGAGGISGRQATWRIVGADGQLLFMSSADSASAAREQEDGTATSSLEPSHIVNIEVVKGAVAQKTYGGPFVNGLVVVTLDQKGTEAWLAAAAARAAKPGAAVPPP